MMADMLNHLWQSTMFAAVVALLCFAFRRNRARLRYGLWFAASVKFLVPFAALAAIGSLVQWQRAPAQIMSMVASPAARDFNAPFAQMPLDPTTIVAVRRKPSGSRRCSSASGSADSRRSRSNA